MKSTPRFIGEPVRTPVENKPGVMDLQAMIRGTLAAFETRRERTKALKACQWVMVSGDGRYVQSAASWPAKPALGVRDSAIVFDGRDNEVFKLRYFQAVMGCELDAEVLPQIVREA